MKHGELFFKFNVNNGILVFDTDYEIRALVFEA